MVARVGKVCDFNFFGWATSVGLYAHLSLEISLCGSIDFLWGTFVTTLSPIYYNRMLSLGGE